MKRSLLVVALLVSAGCAAPLGPSGTATSTPTASSTSSPTATGTDATTPPNDTAGDVVPGVTDGRLRNVSALLAAHTDALVRSGFVTVAVGNATVRRSGILVRANARGRNVVEPNATQYRFWNVTRAGPVTMRVRGYSNGSVEYILRGNGNYARREPQNASDLAGAWVLVTHLEAGNYTVRNVSEEGNATFVTLVADSVDNETAMRKALPSGASNVSNYGATLVVDASGRVHALSVRAIYHIGGRRTSLTLDYRLERLGGVRVDRPDWVSTAVNRTS